MEINGQHFNGYIDTGSQLNVANIRVANKLNLKLYPTDIILRNFSGSHIVPEGTSQVEISIGKIFMTTSLVFANVEMSSVDVIIGQPIINSEKVTLNVTGGHIQLKPAEDNLLEMFSFLDNIEKLPIEVFEHVHIPALSSKRILVALDNTHDIVIISGQLFTGSQNCSIQGCIISGPVQTLNVINWGNKPICWDKGQILTKGFKLSSSTKFPVIEEGNVLSTLSLQMDNIICGNLSENDRNKLYDLLHSFSKCFATDTLELGNSKSVELKIDLLSDKPIIHRPYRLSEFERGIVRDKISDLLEGGIIRESSSNYSSPIVLVKKKTGDYRLCVDYRKLNSIMVKNNYPLPHIEDLISRLQNKKYFCSLDMAQGYYQVPVASDSINKTALVTPDGHYEFVRMPFEIANAPGTFQKMVNNVLGNLRYETVAVYLDDILIPSDTVEQGLQVLRQVLELFAKANLKLNIDKCSFFQTQIDFLGYEISELGIRPGDRKVRAVADFKDPTNIHELRQFLGLSSYFRKFIKDHAKIVAPLTTLLRKNVPWSWESEHKQAVSKIKDILINKPILKIYDPEAKTELHTDACSKGIGSMLLQYEGATLKPVYYFSRSTSRDEKLYHSYELETLAVVESIKRFRVYLTGIHFKIVTDCSAVRGTFEKKDLLPRVARWWLSIQDFDFEIEHRPGDKMKHVDALSRNPVGDVLIMDASDWVLALQQQDESIRIIKEKLAAANDKDILNNYKIRDHKLYRKTLDGKLKLVVPKSARFNILRKYHDDIGHVGLKRCEAIIKDKFWFKNMTRFIKKYVTACLDCQYKRGQYGKQQGQLFPISKPCEPLHTWHIDHLGPFVKSDRRNSYILMIIDSFAKFVFARPTKTTKAKEVNEHLDDLFSMFWTPKRIISDRGKAFTSKAFKLFLSQYQVKHILNAIACPRANGQIERYNRTILNGINTSIENESDWQRALPKVLWGINNTVNDTTGYAPHLLMFGYEKNRHADLGDNEFEVPPDAKRKAKDRMDIQANKMKKRFDEKHTPTKSYNKGDLVLWSGANTNQKEVSRKVGYQKFGGPYKIKKVLGNDRYEITSLDGLKGYKRFRAIVAADSLREWKGGVVDITESESEVNSTDELIDLLEG
ncbi:unnamed protein product [Acanthoscelides obtectus]|uniref:RNA-directed DNA polymerase n=1 Tax=Acanthoscelides obtectus TaxID=200917 RepID=A0A9P0P4H0_ACAOB|nr:unnamed protein product [Acanthoscelides obtectus]CAK1656012.1 Transposon Tf2-6 polyprotein [Acanthoscelides obtectus]